MDSGNVGPQVATDGNQTPIRLDHSGAIVVQPLPEYVELTYRKKIWTLANAAAGVTVAAANVFSSTGPVQPLVGIANPTGSVVNAMLMQIKIVWASGTAAASGAVLAGLAVSGVTGAGGNAAINTGSLSAGGSAVSTFVAAAMTGQTVAHQLLDFIGGPSTGALAANSYPYTVIDYKGLFSCPPGGSLILAAAAAGTSPIVACSMQWAELPV